MAEARKNPLVEIVPIKKGSKFVSRLWMAGETGKEVSTLSYTLHLNMTELLAAAGIPDPEKRNRECATGQKLMRDSTDLVHSRIVRNIGALLEETAIGEGKVIGMSGGGSEVNAYAKTFQDLELSINVPPDYLMAMADVLSPAEIYPPAGMIAEPDKYLQPPFVRPGINRLLPDRRDGKPAPGNKKEFSAYLQELAMRAVKAATEGIAYIDHADRTDQQSMQKTERHARASDETLQDPQTMNIFVRSEEIRQTDWPSGRGGGRSR